MWLFFGLSLVYSAVVSVLRYRNFKFLVNKNQLVLNTGILTKEVTNIPLDRIQSVQLHQNIIQRILRITGLKKDTAGSAAEELEIPALSKLKANALLEFLKSRIEPETQNEESREQILDEENPPVKKPKAPKRKLVDLDFRALLTLAITENHVRNGLIAIAFIMGYAGQYLEYSEEFLIEAFDDYAPELINSGVAAFLSFIVLFLTLSVLLSFVQVMLKFFDFKAEVDDNSFYIASGLLRRNEYTVPLKKIQFLEWKTNFLRKRIGFESISIFQGRSVEAVNRNQLEIPACYQEQTDEVMKTMYEELEEDDYFFLVQPHKFYRVYKFIIQCLVGLPIFGVIGLASGYYFSSVALYGLYVMLCVFWAEKFYHSVNLWINEEVVIYERGWLFPKRTVVKFHKFQTVELDQSIFQKRRGICHFTFSTAAGGRRFRFFDKNQMEELRDYALYKAESFSGKWM